MQYEYLATLVGVELEPQLLRCPQCRGVVHFADTELHDEWHRSLESSFRAAFDAIGP